MKKFSINRNRQDDMTPINLKNLSITFLAGVFLLMTNVGMATAAEIYIRAGARGNGSGIDWTNAMTDLPTSFTRGTTYYLADGSYSSRTLATANKDTQTIVIKKATSNGDHGTATDWNSSYGVGQATIPSFNINSSYWIIDGQKGKGFSVVPPDRNPANYGIQFTSPNAVTVGTNASTLGTSNPGTSVTDITIKHVYAAVSLTDPISAGNGFVFGMYSQNRNASVSNLYIGYGYFTGWGQALTMNYDRQWSNVTWEYNVYEEMFTSQTAGGPGGLHGNPINANYAPVTNLVVRYSLFYHTYGDGGLSQVIAANNSQITNSKIYGNVFDQTWSGRSTISGNYHGTTENDCVYSTVVYNNTFLRTATGAGRYDVGGLAGDECAGGITFKNNLAYDLRASFGPGVSSTYNEYIYTRDTQSGATDIVNSENTTPFKDMNARDYTRISNSSLPGTPLPAEYGFDATGKPRNTWTRGAFEYSVTDPNSPSAPSGLRVASQ